MTIFLIAAAVLACTVICGMIIWDSNRFVKVSYRISCPLLKKKIRLALLSDLHNKEYGADNQKLLDAIREAAPDMVLIAGDLLTSCKDDMARPAVRLLESVSAEYPVCYANGNHEYRVFHQPDKYGSTGARYRHAIRSLNLHHLEDGSVYFPEYNIRVYGLDLPVHFFKKFKEPPLDPRELKKRLGKADKSAYTILLAHNPVWFDSYVKWGADLTLSGHVHGGVVRLPFLGGVLSTSFRLFPRYDGGSFKKDNKEMIISRGLGAHTIPLRLFNPAELVIIDLIPEEE